jgi:hypothetical protein
MAGVVAGAGAEFHWMRLETRRELSATEENLEKAVKEVDDHCLRRAPARLPSASSLARRLLLLPAIEFLGVLVLERGSLDWQRLERLGAPTVLIYGTGKEIVARDRGAYPEKFGRWRASLTESSSDRLEFKLSHIRLTGSVELRSDRCSGLVLFDQSCRMNRLKLLARQSR